MSPSPLPLRFPFLNQNLRGQSTRKATELESMARLLEDFIPRLKSEADQQFYREVIDSYRDAARDVLHQAQSRQRR